MWACGSMRSLHDNHFANHCMPCSSTSTPMYNCHMYSWQDYKPSRCKEGPAVTQTDEFLWFTIKTMMFTPWVNLWCENWLRAATTTTLVLYGNTIHKHTMSWYAGVKPSHPPTMLPPCISPLPLGLAAWRDTLHLHESLMRAQLWIAQRLYIQLS